LSLKGDEPGSSSHARSTSHPRITFEVQWGKRSARWGGGEKRPTKEALPNGGIAFMLSPLGAPHNERYAVDTEAQTGPLTGPARKEGGRMQGEKAVIPWKFRKGTGRYTH